MGAVAVSLHLAGTRDTSASAPSEPPADHLGTPREPAEDEALLREAIRRERLDAAFHLDARASFGDPIRAAYPAARPEADMIVRARRAGA